MRRLEGRANLVTGAAGAIGRATALRVAHEGASLILADRFAEPLDLLRVEIADADGAAAAAVYDAVSGQSSADMVEQACRAFGRLDAVCNIGGIYAKAQSAEVSDDDWTRMLQVNLSSVFSICRAAIPRLAKTGGCVVNTASLAAFEGLAYATAYAASKAGVIALTKSLAAEFASTGIRFNAVAPGGIRSGMSTVPPVPAADPALAFRRSMLRGFEGGLGNPSDVAAAFAYLVSDDARFVSGSVLVVDGAQFQI